MGVSKIPYMPVREASPGGSPRDSDDESTLWLNGDKPGRSNGWGSYVVLTATVLNVASFILWTTLSLGLMFRWPSGLNHEIKQTSAWSPLYDLFDLNIREYTVAGTLYPGIERPVARQMPNHEAEAVWDEWELTRVFPITGDEVLRLGKDLETAVQLEDKYFGRGDNMYAATFDVYHQLHCINMLRWYAYGPLYNRTFLDPAREGFNEVHINHCVDLLVQTIQCSGNLNLITMHWTETQDYPFPDFSIQKKCVDFDKLTDWRKENTVDMDMYVKILGQKESKPKNATQRPAPDEEYNRIYGKLADTGRNKHFDTSKIPK